MNRFNFIWEKKDRLFVPKENEMFSYASHPTIIQIEGDKYLVAFTRRDTQKRSHVFLMQAIVKNGVITLKGKPKLALSPGDLGFFDSDGVISVCLVKHKNVTYLYYVGWQNLPNEMWICDTGRAIVDMKNVTAKKEFLGPVLGRDKNHPLFAAATAFYITNDDVWHTWYNSGVKWVYENNKLKHYYGIHYANSQDGINWTCEKNQCIPFADKYEYAFGRPSVVLWDGLYLMWYAHRATKNIDAYRIGLSFSKDGRKWERIDKMSGIDVSDSGWDSEMICYPYVFEHDNYKYMLYNGNSYGKTGFGYAVLKK